MMLAMLAMTAVACAAPEEDRDPFKVASPESYKEAMEAIEFEVHAVDAHLIGSHYELAGPEAAHMLETVKTLGMFYPDTISANWEAYEEYEAEADDLRRTNDRLLLMIQLRKKEDAKDQLEEFARRFNRLSRKYGPKLEIGVLERGPEKFRDAEYSESELSGSR
ncbi:MAG: hypothetical protein V3V10_00920, partial [Planctomycetota bacterium]